MKILIVEDNKLMRDVIRNMLRTIGFTQIGEADDGDTALTACEAVLPDIILLDWEMPRLNGINFIVALRAMPGGKNINIIMCTSRDEYADITEALDGGANDFIMKPFTADILASKLALAGAA